jgi:glycosyltransferase involved in cell wall biosynthesis
VVLGTYNGAQFLEEQLDSFLGQTQQPDELIVGDDGSTDNTLALLTRFAERAPFPVRIHDGPQAGLAANFLSSAQRATGDFVAFSDQDDVWLPLKLQTMLEAVITFRANLAFHAVRSVDDQLKPIRSRSQVTRSRCWSPCRRNVWVPLAGNTMLVARNVIEQCNWQSLPMSQWYPGALVNHDEYVSLIAAASGLNVRISDRLVLYRQHGANAAGAREAGVAPSSWHPGSYVAYVRNRADAARDWERVIVPCLERENRPGATTYYRRAARVQDRRAQFLDASIPNALVLYAWHLLSGDYRSSTPSGLGWRALLRDAYYLTRRIIRRNSPRQHTA